MLVTRQNFEEALARLTSSRLIADAESTDLFPWLGATAVGWAVKSDDFAAYFSVRHVGTDNITPGQYLALLNRLADADLVVNHNTGFDENLAFVDMGRLSDAPSRPWRRTVDTMVGCALYDENGSKGLKDFSDRYLGAGSSDEQHALKMKLIAHKLKPNEMGKLPASEVAPYAIQDVILADRLDGWLRANLYKPALYDEYSEFSQLLAKMTRKGLPIDLDANDRLDAEAAAACEATLAEIRARSGVPHFNPNSQVHVRTWLRTKDAQESTLLACHTPEAELILEFKAWNKARQYFKTFRTDTVDGRLHGSFNPVGTVAGRISHSNPNLGAMPTNKKGHKTGKQKNKDAVVAPPGYLLVEADYSQAEPRGMAHYAGDENLRAIFAEGRDLHSEVAKMCGVSRHVGKTINMALLYGMGPKTMGEKLGIPFAKAKGYMDAYFAQFPSVKTLLQKGTRAAERDGFIVMGDGRRRHYNGTTAHPKDAIPNLIQGRVAIMVRRAMLRLDRELPEFDMLLQVHDSLLGLVKEEDAHRVIPELRRIMEDQPWSSVPHKVDVKAGPSWGEAKEVKV